MMPTWNSLDTASDRGNRILERGLTDRLNTLWMRQNGCRFTDYVFKCIFFNENVWISIKNSLKFVPKGLMNNIPALVQLMAWHQAGDKPSSEPMMVTLLMQICITLPQWVETHWGTNKMACILQMTCSNNFFNEKYCDLFKISLKWVHRGSQSAIIQ